MRQSALESGCKPTDFLAKKNLVVESKRVRGARKNLELPYICDLTYYGNGVVASVHREHMDAVRSFVGKYQQARLFETPVIYELDEYFRSRGSRVCFQLSYYLPDLNEVQDHDCGYDIRVLEPWELDGIYSLQWRNALSLNRRELDVLAVGAFCKNNQLVGLAGCSADCETMWQAGYDVLPEYRGKGIGSTLLSRLAIETVKRGKVPFCRVPWCNIKSVRNANRAGFRLAWTQVTVKNGKFTEGMMQSLCN